MLIITMNVKRLRTELFKHDLFTLSQWFIGKNIPEGYYRYTTCQGASRDYRAETKEEEK